MFRRENDFKETPLGKVPRGWEPAKLGDVGSLKYGITTSATKENTGVKLLRITDVTERGVHWENVPYCKVNEAQFKKYKLEVGDILFARIGATTGKTCHIDRSPNAVFGSYLIRFRPHVRLDTKFLYHYTQSRTYWNQVNKKREGQLKKGLSIHTLGSVIFPFPPPSEQHQISGILSEIEKGIENTDEIIAKTERLKKGLMHKLLTKGIGHKEFRDGKVGGLPNDWKLATLGDICETIGGGTPSKKQPAFWGGSIPWISPKDMQVSLEIHDSEDHITAEALEESSAKLVKPNSVLVVFRSGILTRRIPVAVNRIPVAINQDLKALIPRNSLTSEFLAYYLIGSEPIILRYVKRGSTVHSIVPQRFFRMQVPVPPPAEQREIVEVLSTVDRKLELERKRKKKLNRIKQGFADSLLSGVTRFRAE